MKATERRARDALIETLFRRKVSQTEIGRRVGLHPPQVHRILEARGLLEQAIPRANSSTARTIWDEDDFNRLRRRIYERQRKGAREALRAME